jgi:hypothetical protein
MMARADLLIKLVQSGLRGDQAGLRKVVEAVIAEERANQNKVLAGRLEAELHGGQAPRPPALLGSPAPLRSPDGLLFEIAPQKKLADLILPDEARQICQGLVQERRRADLLRSHNLEPRNRALFIGPPGNGKTSLAEALAEALAVPLLVARYESLINSYLGETAKRLDKMFDQAADRDCVLFLD